MYNPEFLKSNVSRSEEIAKMIAELRNTAIINQSDPSYAAEIHDRIDELKTELNDLLSSGQ